MKNKFEEKLPLFQIVIVVLSLYILISLIISSFVRLEPEIQKLLQDIDNFICIIFLIDFFIRFKQAKNKVKFMKWG